MKNKISDELNGSYWIKQPKRTIRKKKYKKNDINYNLQNYSFLLMNEELKKFHKMFERMVNTLIEF